MKISTPLNSKSFRDHLTYSWYKYLIVAVVGCVAISLIYTVTAYHSPEDKRIDVCFVSSYANAEKAQETFTSELLPDIPFVSEVETLECTAIPIYDDGYSTTEVLLLRLGVAHEIDIAFIPEEYFVQYAREGCFIPLEDLVSNGTLYTGAIDLAAGYTSYIDEEAGISEKHLYGIPTDQMTGLYDEFGFSVENAFMCITVVNGNEENVNLMAKAILSRYIPE